MELVSSAPASAAALRVLKEMNGKDEDSNSDKTLTMNKQDAERVLADRLRQVAFAVCLF
jgi:hypothetical protein